MDKEKLEGQMIIEGVEPLKKKKQKIKELTKKGQEIKITAPCMARSRYFVKAIAGVLAEVCRPAGRIAWWHIRYQTRPEASHRGC